jgi:Ribulose-5-phosphate 4-epimerase and related epimerases and aldolases
MTELEARKLVVEAGQALVQEGLVQGTWGNVSMRISPTLMAITPTGSDYLRMKAEDIVLVDLETGEASGGKPSSEKGLHAAIYKARPEICAVIHTHSLSASTCAAAHREVPPVLDDLAQIVGPSLRVADYALPGTAKMGKVVLKALKGRMAALMANHGAVALGRTMEEALVCARVLEKGCRVFIESEFLGGPVPLGGVEAAVMHQVYLRKYSKKSIEEARSGEGE